MSPSPALRRPLALLTALVTTAAAALIAAPSAQALAPDQPVLAGSLQDELGCAEDWMPQCEATALVLDAATGRSGYGAWRPTRRSGGGGGRRGGAT